MRAVSELYGRHEGADIYVVGTGTSLRVFPHELLAGRITIGLNLAWQTIQPRYSITIHPDFSVPEFLPEPQSRPEITWIAKHDKLRHMPAEQIAHAEENFYFFRTDGQPNTLTDGLSNAGRIPSWVDAPTGDFLYLWGSIATSGVNLAANMGAKNIFLVGCDNSSLVGNHHALGQHTKWLGHSPDDRYRDYYEGLAEVRSGLRSRGVNLVSLTPFLTLGPHEDDFTRLCQELGTPVRVDTFDITPQRGWSAAGSWGRFRTRARTYGAAMRNRGSHRP